MIIVGFKAQAKESLHNYLSFKLLVTFLNLLMHIGCTFRLFDRKQRIS